MSNEQEVNQPAKREKQEPLNALQLAELELKQIEIAERKQALQDRKDEAEIRSLDLVDKRAAHESKKNSKARGKRTQESAAASMAQTRAGCNHHVGGDGAVGIQTGQGDLNRPSCLGGIQFLDGTIRLRCLRCGQPWRSNMPNGGDYNGEQHGPWNEGVTLWRNNQNKTFSVVGGLKVSSTAPQQI